MNSKQYRELSEAYQSIYERQIGVPTDNPDATLRKIIKSNPKYGGGEVVPLKPTASANVQKAHYEPEGEELTENPLASLDRLAKGTVQTVGGVIGKNQGQKTGIPGGGTVGGLLGRQKGGQMYDKAKETVGSLLKQSYELDDELVEDLEERRKQLAQRQREGAEGFKQRIADRASAHRKRLAKKREKDQLKAEIKREIAKEAVGDPISPNSVFKLTDPVNQKNLQSTMKPAGPPPMKPAAPKAKQQSNTDRFVKRIVGSTMLSPL